MHLKTQERIHEWLNGPYDPAIKAEIRRLMQENPAELADAFYRDLSFGTGGMRGIMGIGANRMNIYTVRTATQGLSNYLLKQNDAKQRVFIGYDVRTNSRLFAEESARVLAANGIEAHITKEICPTPLASYACRTLRCSAAIMITASHNPPQYNGYKVFWSDGAQVVPPHDEGIIAEVRLVHNPDQIRLAPIDDPLIHWVDREIDQAYLNELAIGPAASDLRVIYTNLHGTGLRILPQALQRQGFTNVSLVQEQRTYDGNFPAAPSPNPEEESPMALGTKQLMAEKADLLLATDPDADRLGVVVIHRGTAHRLNGNDIAALCLDYLATFLQSQGKISKDGAFIKTIVTSELTRKIAISFGLQCHDVLTGFKYIAERIREWESGPGHPQFLFGAEESHGYLAGTFVRDKDAISAACLVCRAAENAKKQNQTLIDRLHEIFRLHGVHRQMLASIKFPDSSQGMEKMQSIMVKLRQNPPHEIAGQKVSRLDDYLQSVSINQTSANSLPVSDVLSFWLEDKSKIVIRPSGTEPKIKIYLEVCAPAAALIEDSIAKCDQKLSLLASSFENDFLHG